MAAVCDKNMKTWQARKKLQNRSGCTYVQ